MLKSVKAIRSLTWRGLQRIEDSESVRECFKEVGPGIKTLELDFLEWVPGQGNHSVSATTFPGHPSIADNFFARGVLDVCSGNRRVILPNLRSLSLSAVSFKGVATELQYTLNIVGVRFLRLSRCPHSLDPLDAIVLARQPPQLKFFELVLDGGRDVNPEAIDATASVFSFLATFKGLEDLALLLPEQTDWERLSQAVLMHSQTLKRLTSHARRYYGQAGTGDSLFSWKVVMENVSKGTNLDFIGNSHSLWDWVRTDNETF